MPGPRYYVLDSSHPERMMLYEPPDPSDDDGWLLGRMFLTPPPEPVVVKIQPGNENSVLLPFFASATLMSDALYAALRAEGVDNLDVYDAEIRSADGSVVHRGYKAFNVIGVIRAADLSKTVFLDPPGTTLIDASMENFTIDPLKAHGALLFRPAEFLGAVIVHERIKRAIEAKGFPHLVFRETADLFTG